MKKLLQFVFIFTLVSTTLFAQKDTIKLANNDVLVGSIEKMDRSILTFSTSYDDSDFKIKWGEVAEIRSDQRFIISITDGERYTSTIRSIKAKDKIVEIDNEGNRMEFALDDIVFIEPIGGSFLARLTVDMDVGITITKANDYKQLTTNLSATYLAYDWKARAIYKTVLT